MLIYGEGFPFTPLAEMDAHFVKECCGGEPLTDTELARNFMKLYGLPQVGDPFMRVLFDNIAWRSVNAINETTHEAAKAFQRGVLMYAGTLSVASKGAMIPYASEVVARAAQADGVNFVLDSVQAIEEVPTFSNLIDEAKVALGIDENERLHQIALTGAGAFHLIATESLREAANSSPDALEDGHPELSDIENLFDDFDS